MARRSTRRSKTRTHALILATYTAAIFLSALLLFGVQPMFTRMVLPRLGGSPSVWSVAMVFFQSMLLAGYAYAHVLTSFAAALCAGRNPSCASARGRARAPAGDCARLGHAAGDRYRRASGCSDSSRSRSACRSSRRPPTIHCCRHGSCAPAIPMRMTRIFFTRHRTSAASLRCSRIPRCSNRFSHYRCKIECGASALCC